ncbi:MAG TPA: TrkA C-terminal domain-containing protein [Candidatus Acidoferrales bacterium]|nr:TrkA C-terminal domain-containing protein [Candidatus Acidoferrales bacterium]
MPRFEKVKYRAVPVRELFLEMKNLSELMIDLAYSAALFNDQELAEDILELESRVDTLDYQLEMTIMIAARDAHDAEALTGVSAAASAADKISDAAGDIAAIVTQGIGVHPIVSQVFEKAEERLMQARVGADSSLVGKRVGELDLEAKMGIDIIAVRRDKDWIINPKKTEQIRNGDVLIARGVQSGISEFKGLVEQKPKGKRD